MKYVAYLLYIILWETAVFGSTWYAVFMLDASGWWFLLAYLLSISAYPPGKWFTTER